jgi:hypothetical protein
MSDTWAETTAQVIERAASRCEYCMMHQSLQGATFHVEHIHPKARGGASELGNLALACPGCNFGKSDRVALLHNESGKFVRVFNPRSDRWSDHFRWSGYRMDALTEVGHALIDALDLNSSRRQLIRRAEEGFGLFPPDE